MAYTMYETKTVIMGVRPIQENDLFLRVFSNLFGYITIVAKGTRKVGSKLRGHIREYSLSTISVVKGKEMFRLTDAREIFSFEQSRSVVSFLRAAEKLFFHHEEDHGLQTHEHIYQMMVRLSKLLVYIVNENSACSRADVQDFFTVYVRGEQGFLPKVEWGAGFTVENFFALDDEKICRWVEGNKGVVQELLRKDRERVV